MENTNWSPCNECKGRGKKTQRLRKKSVLNYENAIALFIKNGAKGKAPIPPKGHKYNCEVCNGTGIIPSTIITKTDNINLPHVAIIGGGIGGVALAVACLHRGIPFTLYERDTNFNSRSQGYGLTLQQASNAVAAFGITNLEGKINSTKHIVHNTKGEVIGEWGMRKWIDENSTKKLKRVNIHIARQSLRLALLEQLKETNNIQWEHQFINLEQKDTKTEITFNVNGVLKKVEADLVVGADGIRSTVRKLVIPENKTPLRYLNCIVILGICSLESLNGLESNLLNGETVFQTANGIERIYMMPYSATEIMWQLSYPLPENEALKLSKKGADALKKEACKRTQWHSPIPEIVKATATDKISGYPVYDRAILNPELLTGANAITLIGDAAHPMSPFKGQGANQALLDALSLARKIAVECKVKDKWKTESLRSKVLTKYEAEMIKRTTAKVEGSAAAASFLHSEAVLQKINAPRGKYREQ